MGGGNRKKPLVAVFLVSSIFLTLFAMSSNLASAGGGSIAMANTYPEDRETYMAVDHFMYQTSSVNTNTTVSVSIDNGVSIPLVFQDIRNELVKGDTIARDWYTWQATTPNITDSGEHSFKFLIHYYVWQDVDHYWAEFNANTTVQSFTIKSPFTAHSSLTPTATTTVSQLHPVSELQNWIILSLIATATLLSLVFIKKKKFAPKRVIRCFFEI